MEPYGRTAAEMPREDETASAAITVACATVRTPIGRLFIACTPVGVVRVAFEHEPRALEHLTARRRFTVVDEPARTASARRQIEEYVAGRRTRFDLPVDWSLTSGRQRQVLQVLHASVPFGEVVTYGQLAGRSGSGVPARGVGAIMGSNPVPLIVPCHRVVASDGLGGFGGGVEVKRWLLTLEGVLPPTLDWEL